MSLAIYSELRGKRILLAGAGVTGIASAKSLLKKGAEVTLADEKVTQLEGLEVTTPSAVELSKFDALFISPGWPENHRLISQARELKLPLMNEIDYAWSQRSDRVPAQRWIGVTGTNGKTTTVEMVTAMIGQAGIKVIACGNVGTTVIESVESVENYQYLVVELSSFQLHWMKNAHFVASAILNIADDHLDWHGSFAEYAADKLRLLESSTIAILNSSDSTITSSSTHWQGRKVFFSLDTPAPGEIGIVEELLVDRAFVADSQEAGLFAELNEIKPTVPHNVANALAAAGLARAAGISHEDIRAALQSFKVGRHRIETIFEGDGITWIDDSKATNPHAATASLLSALSVVWIAGGLAKGAQMKSMVERTHGRLRSAILIGTDRELIAKELRALAPLVEIIFVDPPTQYQLGRSFQSVDSSNEFMEEIVRACLTQARSGDSVVLAPACASMDQFTSYADRGERFKAAVEKVVRDGK